VSAAKAIERAHRAIQQLLAQDESTRLLSGAQREELRALLASLAAAHGELWMSGGSEERAREHLEAAFSAAVTFSESVQVPPSAREVLVTVRG
jgi:hypothetical protein